jgi:hypothetical protein
MICLYCDNTTADNKQQLCEECKRNVKASSRHFFNEFVRGYYAKNYHE